MPIDTSIYNNIKPVQIDSPFEAQAKAFEFQNAQAKNKLAQMMLGEKERELAGDNALAGLLSKGLRSDEIASGLASQGYGKQSLAYTKQASEMAKQQREAEKAQLENKGRQLEMIGQIFGPVVQNPALYQQALAQARELIPGGGKDLPDQYDPAVVQGMLQRAMSAKDQVAQVWKAKEFDLDEQKFGEQKRHNRSTEGISAGNLGVARANLGIAREKLEFDKSKPGRVAGMSATMQKELFEADDTVQSSKNVIGLLKNAQDLNDKAYSGFGAKTRASIRGQLPGDTSSADSTIDLDNIMTGQALESLKAVFGGMPTEGERKILMDMQASADKTPTQRKAIMDRAIKAAENRQKFNEQKAKSLRDGSYTTTGPADTAAEPSDIDALLRKYGS
jgi:hypothetical protein